MKLYRQVSTTERLPEKEGKVLVEDGAVMFLGGKFWELGYASEECYPDFWLEEFSLPTKSEIERKYLLNEDAIMNLGCRQGANYIINLIKNK